MAQNISGGRPFAPYAPVQNVVEVIHKVRDRDLPQPVSAATLNAIGIPEGNAPRTLQAVKFLKILQEDGYYADAAERLKLAGTDEYPKVLADLVRDSYQLAFKMVDPATDPDYRVADAFRQYQPDGQRPRMVTLFMGLCAEAGIADRPARATPSRDTRGPERTDKRRRQAAREAVSRAVGPFQASAPVEPGTVRDAAAPASLLFGVTEEDIAELDDGQFSDVWNALGTVARARAKARQRQSEARPTRETLDPFAGLFGTASASRSEQSEEQGE